ncbi:MAG: AAA family ATPase [Spirochaetaceae bacterium]|jgi:DNA polymerase III gamma/tau subunit|nr:AAA family ATPase [Spirochaetaceae bacterium]
MLAVDYRPFSWDDICGNKSIVSELKKRSLNRDFPTVMFFAGDSGTGKTTCASIIAALINDDNPIRGEGCLNPNPESPESKAILKETFNMSCSMYDASKMGKEDVMQLEEIVSSESFFGGKRVFIIDEAQALSQHAKGVTLKLLEKKRENAHIILCTMNPDAFDISVRSRGLFYKFRSPSSSDIAECLFGLLGKLNLADSVPGIFIQEGIFAIAENCEGSVRLAVQTLDRCIAGEFYSADAIAEAFGFVGNAKLFEIVSLMLGRNTSAFREIKKMDLKEFFYLSYRFISDCLVYQRIQLADAPWKADQYSRLENRRDAMPDLFNLYSDIDIKMGAYFKPVYCLARLTDFFKENAPRGLAAAPPCARVPAETSRRSPVGESGYRKR